MKVCMDCGAMISPYPIHKETLGTCDDCNKDLEDMFERLTGIRPDLGRNEVDHNRPKLKGKHMIVKKSQAQILIEKRQRELGRRYY